MKRNSHEDHVKFRTRKAEVTKKKKKKTLDGLGPGTGGE